jgi:hypothetical protein
MSIFLVMVLPCRTTCCQGSTKSESN